MSTPLVLSNNFILRALQENVLLSPMKLQKLIYFTYRDYLQTTGIQLFTEQISAWRYGPVVESVYNHFKPFGASSINRFYKDSAGDASILVETNDLGKVISSVWSSYRSFDGIVLSEITHRQGTAWYKAWMSRSAYLNNEDIKNERVS